MEAQDHRHFRDNANGVPVNFIPQLDSSEMSELDATGFCITCGAEHSGYEPDLVTRLRKYLGKHGVHFFWTLLRLTKTVSPVLRTKGMIPSHPVHFREGTQIRNFLRDQPECSDWTQDDLDDKWAALVEKAVRLK
jgi:hypothetical protein